MLLQFVAQSAALVLLVVAFSIAIMHKEAVELTAALLIAVLGVLLLYAAR